MSGNRNITLRELGKVWPAAEQPAWVGAYCVGTEDYIKHIQRDFLLQPQHTQSFRVVTPILTVKRS